MSTATQSPSAAANATRSLLSPSSTDTPNSTPTSNYETAAASSTKNGQLPTTTAQSVAASVADRPGAPLRTQSWKMSDLKGMQQGMMVDSAAAGKGPGYSSTAGVRGK